MADHYGLRTGAALSLVLHGGVVLIAALGLPSLWSKPLPLPGVISVDLVIESADSLALYEPEEVNPAAPEKVRTEALMEDAALTDERLDPLEVQEMAALEPENQPPPEQVADALPDPPLAPDDLPVAEPDPALENAVTLAQRIPPEIVDSRKAEVIKPVTLDKPVKLDQKVTEVEPQPAESKIAQSMEALVAREILPRAEVSTAEDAPARIVETKSEVIAAAEVEPDIQPEIQSELASIQTQEPVQAVEAAPELPLPATPLPREKPQRIAALAPQIDSTPKRKKTRDKPKKKKTRSFSDVASAVGRVQSRVRTGTGNIPRLSNAEWDPLRAAIRKCWRLDAGAKEQAEIVVRVQLNRGGFLRGPPKLLDSRSSSSAYTRVAFRKAVDALRNCQPYNVLPVRKYAGWQEIELVFRPDGVGIQ